MRAEVTEVIRKYGSMVKSPTAIRSSGRSSRWPLFERNSGMCGALGENLRCHRWSSARIAEQIKKMHRSVEKVVSQSVVTSAALTTSTLASARLVRIGTRASAGR